MDEEAMWKGIYDKLQEIKSQPPTEHDQQYVFVVENCIFFLCVNMLQIFELIFTL